MRQGCIRGVYGLFILTLSIYSSSMNTRTGGSQIEDAFKDFIEEWASSLAADKKIIDAPAYGADEGFNPLEQFQKDQSCQHKVDL